MGSDGRRLVGIDVTKARFDVHVLPSGEAGAVGRDTGDRRVDCAALALAADATGALENEMGASLSAAGAPAAVVILLRLGLLPRHSASGRRQIPSARR
jgi:hypothetical protein